MRGKGADKKDRVEKITDLGQYIFTKSEKAIIGLMECGFSNKKIAKILSKSEQTIKGHLTNLYAKLSIKSRYQLIVYVKGLKSRYKFPS